MPAHYEISTEHEVAVIRLVGVATGEEVDEVQRRYLADARWRPTYRVLWDRRGLERLEFPYPAFQMLLDTTRALAERLGPGRTAVVAPRAADHARTATYAAAASRLAARHPDRALATFQDLASAAEWLGVPADVLGGLARPPGT